MVHRTLSNAAIEWFLRYDTQTIVAFIGRFSPGYYNSDIAWEKHLETKSVSSYIGDVIQFLRFFICDVPSTVDFEKIRASLVIKIKEIETALRAETVPKYASPTGFSSCIYPKGRRFYVLFFISFFSFFCVLEWLWWWW